MYAIQGRPRDKSEGWVFCRGYYDVPNLFSNDDFGKAEAESELEDWQFSTPDWKYRIVSVELVVKKKQK